MTTRKLAAVPDRPRRGVGLIRVSKARGREDLISPELQRTAIGDYADRSAVDIVEWIEVLDESASKDRSRWWPVLEEVISRIEAGEWDVVVVWKYSRAARHRRRWAVAIDRIEVAGGALESATEGLDTSTSTGRLARGMLAELNAWESEVKGEQWKETQARRRSKGLPHGGHDRFGYIYTRGVGYTKDPETAEILAACYRRYLAGEGHTTIARWLNRQAVPTIRKARTGWSVQAVIRLLDNGFGAGLIHQASDASWYPGAHEAVITAEEWEAYREARRLRWDIPARVRQPAYALTGLVKCGLCGRALVVASNVRQGPGYMYRCTTRITSGTCPGVWATRTHVEARVREWLQEQADDVDVRAAGKTARRIAAATVQMDAKALNRELLRLEQAAERARGYLVDGTLTKPEYEVEKDRLGVRRAEIEKRKLDLQTEVGWLTGPAVATVRGLLRDWETLPVRVKRDLLATLIRRIEVRPGVRGAQLVTVWSLWEPEPGR